MKVRLTKSRQSGVTMVIALIMLVLLTLLVITAYSLSTSNLRAVGNMQMREESIAAANAAVEIEVGKTPSFTATPSSVTHDIDINNDGTDDYRVVIAAPVCVRATQAISDIHSSVTLGAAMSSSPYFNTVWDFDATVTELHGSGATVRIRQGARALLTEAEKNAKCS